MENLIKYLDIQMISFVGASLLSEYLNLRIPRIYYWKLNQRQYKRKENREIP